MDSLGWIVWSDQDEIEANLVGYGRSVRKRVPDYVNNRECCLVLRRFAAGAIVEMAGGVFASNANALGRQRPPTEGLLSKNCWYQKCQASQQPRFRTAPQMRAPYLGMTPKI